jgi:hypothetical protein
MRHHTPTLALLLGAALGCGADPADVVVRLRDVGGATALLRAAGQPIHRTG